MFYVILVYNEGFVEDFEVDGLLVVDVFVEVFEIYLARREVVSVEHDVVVPYISMSLPCVELYDEVSLFVVEGTVEVEGFGVLNVSIYYLDVSPLMNVFCWVEISGPSGNFVPHFFYYISPTHIYFGIFSKSKEVLVEGSVQSDVEIFAFIRDDLRTDVQDVWGRNLETLLWENVRDATSGRVVYVSVYVEEVDDVKVQFFSAIDALSWRDGKL